MAIISGQPTNGNDMSIGSDKIVLSKTTFDNLFSGAGGSLNPFEFEVVDTFFEQFTSNAKITYNSGSGDLTFNRNGSVLVGGDAEGGTFADLNPGNLPGGAPIITAADILIVAQLPIDLHSWGNSHRIAPTLANPQIYAPDRAMSDDKMRSIYAILERSAIALLALNSLMEVKQWTPTFLLKQH